MGNIIKTNTESLQKTQEQMHQLLKSIRDAIEKITEDVNTLNASWTGVAHDTFVQSITDDITVLNEACEGIDSIINYEGKAVTEYNQCENKVLQLIEQIKV